VIKREAPASHREDFSIACDTDRIKELVRVLNDLKIKAQNKYLDVLRQCQTIDQGQTKSKGKSSKQKQLGDVDLKKVLKYESPFLK
jgi:hypothetical protein